jgi:hypothetical protein
MSPKVRIASQVIYFYFSLERKGGKCVTGRANGLQIWHSIAPLA